MQRPCVEVTPWSLSFPTRHHIPSRMLAFIREEGDSEPGLPPVPDNGIFRSVGSCGFWEWLTRHGSSPAEARGLNEFISQYHRSINILGVALVY